MWQYVEGLDLTRLYQRIAAVEGHVGRSPTDPKILMALWLYATLDAVGSARQLDRLCRDHVAYQWIAGGVSLNYHTLADFRTAHTELLDELLSASTAARNCTSLALRAAFLRSRSDPAVCRVLSVPSMPVMAA